MKTYREAIFSGWFGPMGVGAVFLSEIAREQMENIYEGQEDQPVTIKVITPVVLFIVLSSTLVHGTTIPLFKIGKRIRTRTLSITSTGSGQVLRLPKLQFGQQLSLRRNDDEGFTRTKEEQEEAISQLKRNTLLNTNQYEPYQPQQHQQQDASDSTPTYTIDMDDDDIAEEDFLPGDDDDLDQPQQPKKPTAIPHSLTLPAAGNESQSIRFLEPVNPRIATTHSQNIERNEASVSSFRSWMNRNKEKSDATENEEHGGGLRNLFKRHNANKDTDEEMTSTPTKETVSPDIDHKTSEDISDSSSPQPRIEVWEEDDHVVVENANDPDAQAVVEKTDANWKQQVRQKVHDMKRADQS
jgi:hypothetical protein